MNTAPSAPPAAAFPKYFVDLAPFRAAFDTGVPILMYHKLGDPPRRAVYKGTYVGPKLFLQQLSQFRAAGFQSVSFGDPMPANDNPGLRFILTFDDGFASVFTRGLPLLEQFQFKAIQFLVPKCIGGRNEWDMPRGEVAEKLMDSAQIREWIAAGHAIGAHTLTHPSLTEIPEAQAREEIVSSKKMLEDQFGVPIEHFCYPYGSHNRRIRKMVEEAGYLTACSVTPGLNSAATDRFQLLRICARYRSRELRNLWGLLS